jgi:Tfp pilus assembly protein PilN
MKECLEKTIRAEEQIANETNLQTILRKEIGEIEHDLNELSTFEAKFQEIIKEFQPYEDVFNEVIESSDTFESFDDLMSKSDALSNNQSFSWFALNHVTFSACTG